MDLEKLDTKVFLDFENDKLYNSCLSVRINKQASRCLALLISKSGTVVSKEDIIEICWVQHGTFVSDVTVRQTFFNLRKSLAQLDLPPDVLTTIRGKGYMLASGSISIDGGADIDLNSSEDTTPDMKIDAEIITPPLKRSKWKKIPISVHILIAFLSIVFIFHVSQRKTSGARDIYHTPAIMGCKINMIGHPLDDIASRRDYIISALINKYGFNCPDSTQLYVEISSPVLFGYKGRTFISQCYENPDKNYNACKSYYEVDYNADI